MDENEANKCTGCSKTFSSQKNLKRHQKLSCKSNVKEDDKWICYICGKRVKYRESIRRHNTRFHPSLEQKDICSKCGVFNIPSKQTECENHQPDLYRTKKTNDKDKKEKVDVKSGEKDLDISNGDKTPQTDTNTSKVNTEVFLCEQCGKTFTSQYNLRRHQRANCHEEQCSFCSKSFSTTLQRRNHELTTCSKRTNKSKTFVCGKCGASFSKKWEYTNHFSLLHRKEKNKDSPSSSQPSSSQNVNTDSSSSQASSSQNVNTVNDNRQPWIDDQGNIDEALKDIYERYSHVINRSHRQGTFLSEYNFRIDNNFSHEIIHNQMREIYNQNENVFRINISFGFILRNIDDDSYRYFYAHNNDGVFQTPQTITNVEDLLDLFKKIKHLDILHTIFKQRPNSKWKVYALTNIRYVVFRMLDKTLGMGIVPDFIKRKKCIISLDVNRSTNRPFTDYFCAFRCLAFHRGQRSIYNMERSVKLYRDKWFRHMSCSLKGFRGVLLSQMSDFERIFEVNVNILEMKENGDVSCLYRTRCRHTSTMYLNVFDNHLSYINDIRLYSKSYKCRSCEKVCNSFTLWKRHERTCTNSVHLQFPGKFYSPPIDIFDKLKNVGINVNKEEFYYPYFIVYDFEAYLKKIGEDSENTNTFYTHEHVPISVSICSNVEGFEEPKCIVKEDGLLLDEMFEYFCEIQKHTSEYLKKKYGVVFTALNDILELIDNSLAEKQSKDLDIDDVDMFDSDVRESNYCEPPSKEFTQALQKPNTFMSYLRNLSPEVDSTNENIEMSDEESENNFDINEEAFVEISPTFWFGIEIMEVSILKKLRNQYRSLLKEITEYCDIIPILGFNSSKYDLNLIKRKLFKYIDAFSSKKVSVIKKTNAYLCIQSEKFRFLDISNYLAPGSSYSQFLKAYEINMSKSFMCYEWFDSVEKLKYPGIPPIESFYSSIKKCNVLEEEYIEYQKLEHKPFPPPKTAQENYEMLQSIWIENEMETFEDFLVYYNNLDTKPFVLGVQKMLDFYREMDIHPFKIIVSLPGISRKLLMRDVSPENIFALFCYKTKELYKTFDRNIVGGPSIVFTRYHERDVTKIRSHKFKENAKLCKKIIGMDCNSMYLDAFKRYPMPTGHITRRRCETNFRKETFDKYKRAYHWLSYIMYKEKKNIRHQFNGGEYAIPPFFVDGFYKDPNDKDSRGTIYEFNGCE